MPKCASYAQAAAPVACLTVAHASCSVSCVWASGAVWSVVWIRVLRGCAVVGAGAYGGFAGRQFPLRDASADLDICRSGQGMR